MIGFDAVNDGGDFGEVGVFATRAVGGIREHGDARLLAVESFESLSSVFDNGVELLGVGLFVDAAIGEDEMGIGAFANETAREIGGFQRDLIFAGENDVARGMIEAGDEGIGGAGFEELDGGIEIGCGEEFDIVEVSDGLFCYWVVEFWKNNFHRIIIAYFGRCDTMVVRKTVVLSCYKNKEENV